MNVQLVLRIGRNGMKYARYLTKTLYNDIPVNKGDRVDDGVVVDIIYVTAPSIRKVIILDYITTVVPYFAHDVADKLLNSKEGWIEYD